jgi:hypothetical protein
MQEVVTVIILFCVLGLPVLVEIRDALRRRNR